MQQYEESSEYVDVIDILEFLNEQVIPFKWIQKAYVYDMKYNKYNFITELYINENNELIIKTGAIL